MVIHFTSSFETDLGTFLALCINNSLVSYGGPGKGDMNFTRVLEIKKTAKLPDSKPKQSKILCAIPRYTPGSIVRIRNCEDIYKGVWEVLGYGRDKTTDEPSALLHRDGMRVTVHPRHVILVIGSKITEG